MQGRIRFGPKAGGVKTKTQPRASPIVAGPQPICQACQTQFSRYTCPSCNLHYCTLTCYRSPSHSICSEAFDRQSLMDEIRSSQGTTREEKRAMMEMLKRLDEEQGEEEDEDGDEQGMRGLMDKLQGVDLDSIDPSQLLEYLSPAQRAEFENLLQDSTKIEALMSAHDELKTPWWEETQEEEDEGVEQDVIDDERVTITKKATRPALLPCETLPPLKLGDDGQPMVGPGLLNNIVAVLLAYTYLIRTLSLSSLSSLVPLTMDHQEAYRTLVRLVPFLTTRSTFVFSSVQEVIEKVFEIQGKEEPLTVYQFSQDVGGQFLRPCPVISATQDGDVHPYLNALAALADLKRYFHTLAPQGDPSNSSSSWSKGGNTQAKLGSMKLEFYYALFAKVGEVGSEKLRSLGEEVGRAGRAVAERWEVRNLERKRKGREGKQGGAVVGERRGAFIEEIGDGEGETK